MHTTSVFAGIAKTAPQEDGSLMVYGKATGSDLDLDQQRCDPTWLKQAMPEWFRSGHGGTGGNIRAQHDPKQAVGVATEYEAKGDDHWIKARIVDPVAIAKTKAGVFTGFSIGISRPGIEKSDGQEWIRSGNICEISLVDRPCLPTATFTMCKAAKPGMSIKAADFDSTRMLVRVEEYSEKAAEPDVEKASDMTVTIAEQLAPEQVERLEAIADETKATDALEDCEPIGKSMSGCGCCDQCTEPAAKAIDVDAAKSLVSSVIKGDMPPEYSDEQGDIANAQSAISIISQLIVSEAQEMCDNPAEDCDIQILLSAVQALRCFINREQEQAMGDNETGMVMLAAEPDAEKADNKPYGDVEYADPGYQSDGKKRYPIDTEEHVRAALSYIGQERNASQYSSDQLSKIKARIMAAAKKFGIDTEKAVEPDEVKTVDEVVEKTVEAVEEKTVEPEAEKAVVEAPVDIEQAIAAAIEKAFSSETLEKEDNPIRKTFTAIVEASTKPTAEALTEMGARLGKVEQMAVPGGPALRRTDVERVQSRKNDLEAEVMRYKALASSTEDHMLRKGYAQKAAQLEAEIKAL